MTVALLTIGNEILRGEINNTNSQWLAEHLSELGFEVSTIEVCSDELDTLAQAIQRHLETHSLLIATGGLGPTSDDRTAEAVAKVLGVELVLNDDAQAAIKRRLEARGNEMRPSHLKQARLPAGCEMIPNPEGTAPGFVVRAERCTAYFLPGVPYEMRAMFSQHVEDRLRTLVPSNTFHILLHTVGVGESWLADKLDGIEQGHPGVTIGYRAKSSEVDVRIEARGADFAAARDRAKAVAAEVRSRIGEVIYGEGEQTMPQLAGKSVRARGWRLAVAESCTGGLIAQQLTAQPASDYFVGGAIAYANTAKTNLLGVSEDTLRGHGAVSAEVAAEMAEGARRAFDCEVAISVTGIAGPTGSTGDKPVGLCHYAVATPTGTVVEHAVFSGNRNQVQKKAAHAALNLLRRTLNGHNG